MLYGQASQSCQSAKHTRTVDYSPVKSLSSIFENGETDALLYDGVPYSGLKVLEILSSQLMRGWKKKLDPIPSAVSDGRFGSMAKENRQAPPNESSAPSCYLCRPKMATLLEFVIA